ncbi:MAG: hypothetical protein A2Y25_01105 [Candidatus Melainabacteria bacterium GWF2_37_15]|nr:MAG: hypothetical protein A2Y25_01105 [Candidatus Melainabacteria bacterium GWF2_37_15]
MKIVAFIAGIQIFMSSILFGGLESQLIYYPINQEVKNIWVDIEEKIQDTYFYSRDGVKLNAWYVKAKTNKPTIIYCHGQGENISLWQNVLKFLADKGYGVFMLEYRGHGRSEGCPFESGLYVDLESAIKYLETYEKVPQENIVLWGRSLGGAIVVDVASRNQVKAVILESTFTNIREEALHLTRNGTLENKLGFWRGTSSFFVKIFPMTQKFATDTKIHKIKVPLLIGASVHDTTVPVDMSRKLGELNDSAELFISDTGSHHENDWFFEEVLEFLEKLEKINITICKKSGNYL